MRIFRAIGLGLVLVSSGCAGVGVTRLGKEGDYRDGIRFYRPQPYLLVSSKATGDRQAQIVWLPKKDEEYVLRVRSGLGAVDAKFALQDGWNLTEYGESRDPGTADIVASILGVAKAAEALVASGGGDLTPGLYALVFDPATGLVTSARRVEIGKDGAR